MTRMPPNEELLSNLTYPTSVVLDVPNDRMYWSELGSSTIGIAKLDGTELGTMKAERKIKYMTMFAQQTQQHVARINLKTKTGWSIILEEEYKFSDIKIIRDAVDCYTEPCSNGGSCTEVPVGHSCTCTSGFTGTNCETVLRNCDSSPCQNGGTCVPDANGYRCICKPGFGGAICDKVLRNCDSSPCQNGGTCVPDANGYRCTCKPGFGGAICDEVIGSCDSNPCKSGGTCTEDANGYRCTCKMGFIGSKCEIGLVYLALIIPIVLLVALIIFYLKKSSRGKTPQKHDYSHKGYQTRDVIVHPGYNPSYWM
ncbi:hypothetical protein LSH36_2045g00004 [Paralvinella palmiformis]|uniref:EGF-like domain-containing protein n=1 Tax=Paralvinella palmiformis TaxID=53620 RepID=A0AAD9IR77_9ANNE|nr:hypothetical protein LSH36_2045g00004 [Paralvinella palmiformis]